MKPIFILLFLIFGISLNGQFRIDSVIHSVSVSFNHASTGVPDYSRDYGYGVSFKHNIFHRNQLYIVLGLEFNATNQFYDVIGGSKWAANQDVTYHLNFISVPLAVRYDIFKSKLFAIEVGSFIDFMRWSSSEGVGYKIDFESDPITYTQYKFNGSVENKNYLGFFSAVNLQIPVRNNWVFLRAEYKNSIILYSSYIDNIDDRIFKLCLGYRFK